MTSQGLAPHFSASGDSLAIAGNDGLIRVYDTGSGRLKTTLGQSDGKAAKLSADALANGHLVEQHTSMAWATSGRKKKKTSTWSALLVVGTATGDVKAYDSALGELKWRARSVLEGSVTALAHSEQKPGVVLAAGSTGLLVSLSMENGEVVESFQASKHSIGCLAASPDGKCAFGGGSTLSLWQLASHERLAKYTGHVVSATCAIFASGGTIAASASPGDRHVALWQLPTADAVAAAAAAGGKAAKGRKGQRPAAATLSMQQPPVQLDSCACTPAETDTHMGENGGVQGNGIAAGEDGAGFCVCAVSESGDACVWECTGGEGQGSELQGSLLAQVQIEHAGSSGMSDKILAAKLVSSGTGYPSLVIARGSTARPVFETLTLPHTDSATHTNKTITLPPLSGGVLLPGKGGLVDGVAAAAANGPSKAGKDKAARRHGPEVTVVGPGVDASGAAAPLLRTAKVAAPTQAMDTAGEDTQDAQDAAAADVSEDDELPTDAQVPLGERVAALEAAAGLARPAGDTDGDAAAAGPSSAAGPDAGPVAGDKANSLAVLLTQALRSNDRVLLERCLSTTNATVVQNTVSRLLPVDATAFLRAAVDRLLSSPARAGQLAPWIKAVLYHHTGYIMAAPGAQAPLASLYQAIDARVSVYSQLLRLHGRLGLVTAHSRAAGVAPATAPAIPEPEYVFEDNDSDDGAVEDPFAVGVMGVGEGGEMSESESEGGEGWEVAGSEEESDGGSMLDDDLGDDDGGDSDDL